MKPAKGKSAPELPSDSLVPLDSVLCTEELNRRPPRPLDYEKENRALGTLVQALADSPRTVLQALADTILEVFQADSAGISLLTKDEKRFHWPAIAGTWQPHIGGGTPRDFGPCGDVLDRNAPLLFRHFERRYTYFLPVTPPVEECLLVPFYVEGKAVGTIWAIAHNDRRKFDAEDMRQLVSLGRFASAAYQAVVSLDAAERRSEALQQSHTELAQHVQSVQDSRRAALNLMEDAVRSSQSMEALNVELRESEQRYRTLFNLGPVAVYSCDASGVIQTFNRRAVELWGREPASGDTDERFCGSFKLFRPDGSFMPHEQCPMAEVVSGKISEVRDAEVLIERSDGSRVTVVVNICSLKNQCGEVTGAINCFYDITERKRLEATLREFNVQLEQRVEDRTCEIRASQERLRVLATDLNLAEQRERQRLAADLHDYLAQLLALTKIRLGQAKQQSMTPPMAQALTDTQNVIDQALTYTRTLVAQLSPPLLKQFGLPTALKWLAEQMQQRDLTVSLELEKKESLLLPEDQSMLLFQSIRELLMNVVKHAETKSARITMTQVQGTVHITVADQGAGFDLAAGAVRTCSAPGFGLFSIRERMLALGGRFELESRRGEGTTATLVLPLGNTRVPSSELKDRASEVAASGSSDDSKLRTQNTEPQQRSPGNSKLSTQHSALQKNATIRVLLADDHIMVRQGLRSILEVYQDISVIGEAADGEEAVELARLFSPDVVVMDVNMPKMDGIGAIRRIKAQQPATLIVGLSLSKSDQVEPLLLQAGASHFVSKDSAAERLYEAIITVMKRQMSPDRVGNVGSAIPNHELPS